MARGKTLLSLLRSFRAEAKLSSNTAHNKGARENQVHLLQRTQEMLWEKEDWPHLGVTRYIDPQAGQRYYSPPDDLGIDQIRCIEVRYGEDWIPLHYGVRAAQYSAWDSDLDQRSYPVENWEIHEGEMIEIWPIPENNVDLSTLDGRLRLWGVRQLRPLVEDDDVADLDDRLITLYAAAEYMDGAEGAKKMQLAMRRERDLLGNSSKVKTFSMIPGEDEPARRLQGPPRVHYRDREPS